MRKFAAVYVLTVLVACGAAAPATAPAPADSATLADAQSGVDSQPSADAQATADAALPSDSATETASGPMPSVPPPKPKDALTVMTYNVMCSFCMNSDHPDWEQSWAARLPWLRDVFKRFDPDLMGLQEMQAQLPTEGDVPEVDQLILPGKAYDYYHFHYKKGDDVENDYPDATVLWKKARFDKLGEAVIWLSPTPDKPYSTGFAKIQFGRVMVWVKLHDKVKNRDFWFASTHFDNNAPSQKLSAPLVLEKLGTLASELPLVATGDYNANPAHEAFKLLTAGTATAPPWQDTFELAKAWSLVHNQDKAPMWDPKTRIDHIFVAGKPQFTVAWWGMDLWLYGAKKQAPSDHDGAIVAYVDW